MRFRRPVPPFRVFSRPAVDHRTRTIVKPARGLAITAATLLAIRFPPIRRPVTVCRHRSHAVPAPVCRPRIPRPPPPRSVRDKARAIRSKRIAADRGPPTPG
ncbi:conserved hypothetical protein [Burkholderia pseudomallei 406e]|nr:conserved hypothetical protein [Burkholderia pseudomallei 406e]